MIKEILERLNTEFPPRENCSNYITINNNTLNLGIHYNDDIYNFYIDDEEEFNDMDKLVNDIRSLLDEFFKKLDK